MPARTSETYTAESATALLGLVGVELDQARAAGVAETLNMQVKGAGKAFANLSFETEPATYLVVSAKESP